MPTYPNILCLIPKGVVLTHPLYYHEDNINEAFNSLADLSYDITIVSGDNEEIQTNSVKSHSPPSPLYSLLYLLPDCSTSSIKHLLYIITNGFSAVDKVIDKN